MSMTVDDSYLITCSTDGSICIWEIKDAEGKKVILNDQFAYSDDILVNASELKNKIENMAELKMRVNELERESKYQISQLIKSKEQKIQELNNNHSIVMKILENKNTVGSKTIITRIILHYIILLLFISSTYVQLVGVINKYLITYLYRTKILS